MNAHQEMKNHLALMKAEYEAEIKVDRELKRYMNGTEEMQGDAPAGTSSPLHIWDLYGREMDEIMEGQEHPALSEVPKTGKRKNEDREDDDEAESLEKIDYLEDKRAEYENKSLLCLNKFGEVQDKLTEVNQELRMKKTEMLKVIKLRLKNCGQYDDSGSSTTDSSKKQ